MTNDGSEKLSSAEFATYKSSQLGKDFDSELDDPTVESERSKSIRELTTIIDVNPAGVYERENIEIKDQSLLSPEEKDKLFEALKNIFNDEGQCPKTCGEAKKIGWEKIKSDLEKYPEKMRDLQALIAAGKKPIVYGIENGKYLFGDWREYNISNPESDENVNSVKEDVRIFNKLTDAEKQTAITRAIEHYSGKREYPYTDEEKQSLRGELNKRCDEIPDGCGIGYWQSLIYTAHFGCRLPTSVELEGSAQNNTGLYDKAWTWRSGKDPLDVLSDSVAPYGNRVKGFVNCFESSARNRNDFRGVCSVGLRVSCS